MLEEGLDHEYAPISGFPKFTEASAKLAFGDNSRVIKDKLVREMLGNIIAGLSTLVILVNTVDSRYLDFVYLE